MSIRRIVPEETAMGTTTQLDIARTAALIARLDARTDEPCRVPGCVHGEAGQAEIAA